MTSIGVCQLATKLAGLNRSPGAVPAGSMFAALNTVEPPIVELEQAPYFERDKPWFQERLPTLEKRVRIRLDQLSRRLGDADWLDGEFTAGDLMMVMVLRRLEGACILEEYPNLCAYVARGVARPAYQRAFEDQLAVFTGKSARQ